MRLFEQNTRQHETSLLSAAEVGDGGVEWEVGKPERGEDGFGLKVKGRKSGEGLVVLLLGG